MCSFIFLDIISKMVILISIFKICSNMNKANNVINTHLMINDSSKGSGYADYTSTCNKYNYVPTVVADEHNTKGYGFFVTDYDNTDVIINTWPKLKGRKIMLNTGNQGGIAEGEFITWCDDIYCYGQNKAVNGLYVTAKKHQNRFATREANYHPDSGQVFYPQVLNKNQHFILLLAKTDAYNEPKDDISIHDFTAFKFNASLGFQIYPYIWHQPPYPINDNITFIGKQGKVHACVGMDSVSEFGAWIEFTS